MTFGGFFQRQDDFKTMFLGSIEAGFPPRTGRRGRRPAPSGGLKN
jgi:hypothetical protein